MRVLLDTNIIIDYISKRELFYENANAIITLCAEETIEGCIAAHSVMDALYITRKEYSLDERRRIFLGLSTILDIVGIDKKKIINVLNNADFSDMEDCLQMECAIDYRADYIITRNVSDYFSSKISPILPSDFLKLV